MLSGLQDTGQSMFTKLGVGGFFGPDVEDMEKAAEAARFNKTVKFKNYNVKTFNTSVSKEREEYAELMMTLQQGVQASTHVVWYQDRRFVEPGETAKKPYWLIHQVRLTGWNSRTNVLKQY